MSLREELRRVETVAALVRHCSERISAHEGLRCAITSTPKGAPASERTWSICIVDASDRRHPFFHPTHSDEIDMFAGAVRAGLPHWIDVVLRRNAMHVQADE